ncbi:variable surface protein [Plasmodium gonderi]|uniref:Variable surface protein n=1 Tax=Plasmodium gonderi TaxID=77519 RepID=A0A1Y1JT21_PLAGO|nr:variable surface protein [Plasmodium gonderi]GAW84287.1 variable surface protein [Plasmodium gonderi]
MSKSIYNYIYLFPQCESTKKNITNEEEQGSHKYCENHSSISEDIRSEFNSICKNVLSYFNKMEALKHTDQHVMDGTCVYLHYWLYYDHLKTNHNQNMNAKKLCDALIKLNNEKVDPICQNYKDFDITEDMLKKMKDLYDINTNVNALKTSCTKNETCEIANTIVSKYKRYMYECESHGDVNFCKILEDYKNEYNSKIMHLNDGTATYEILYSFQRNNIPHTIISVMGGTLFWLLFLFILYKFRGDVSYLRTVIRRMRNARNNMDEEWKILTCSDLSHRITRNRTHNISYHSE